MKLLLICICAGLTLPVFAQSKKELQAEVSKLQSQIAQLNSEITALKKPREVDLNDSTKQVSYCFGVVIGSNMKETGLDSLDMESFQISR